MTVLHCPVGVSEAIFNVFQLTKSQIDTESDKLPKVSIFQRFYAFYVRVLTDFVN